MTRAIRPPATTFPIDPPQDTTERGLVCPNFVWDGGPMFEVGRPGSVVQRHGHVGDDDLRGRLQAEAAIGTAVPGARTGLGDQSLPMTGGGAIATGAFFDGSGRSQASGDREVVRTAIEPPRAGGCRRWGGCSKPAKRSSSSVRGLSRGRFAKDRPRFWSWDSMGNVAAGSVRLKSGPIAPRPCWQGWRVRW